MEMQSVHSDLELARRLELAEGLSCARFVETRARVSPESGACRTEIAGTYAMFDGPASPVTQTFGLGVLGDVSPAHLESIEAFFRERDSPVFHEVSPLAGVPVFQLLVKRGYKPTELTSVMYQPLDRLSTNRVESTAGGLIRVRGIDPTDAAERQLWAQVMADGWGETPELREFLLDLGGLLAAKEDSPSFIAEIDGQAIAVASLSLAGGVALLAGACTIPAARQRGAQLALLNTRLRYAASHGCDLAMMCAAPGSSSQRNAERNGFRIAYTRTKWMLGA